MFASALSGSHSKSTALSDALKVYFRTLKLHHLGNDECHDARYAGQYPV